MTAHWCGGAADNGRVLSVGSDRIKELRVRLGLARRNAREAVLLGRGEDEGVGREDDSAPAPAPAQAWLYGG